MIWTDKIFISSSDLFRIDSEVSKVSDAEGITLDGNNGTIRGAIEEASMELQKIMIAFGGYLNSGDLSANHLAAVLNVGIGNSVRQKAVLDQVCVSGDSAGSFNWVKQWAIFWTLRIFYRNAFQRTVKDRYENKMKFYASEIDRRIRPTLFALGIPLVLRPLFAPASFFTLNSGTWGPDNVSLVTNVAGTSTSDLDVAISYVDMSQANLYVSSTSKGNAESELSDRVIIAMQNGKVLEVSIATLNPPTGRQNPAQLLVAVIAPLRATHWNVYVGNKGGTLFLQNSSPIPIGTTTYTFSANPVLSGAMAELGQYPDRRLSLMQTRQRA